MPGTCTCLNLNEVELQEASVDPLCPVHGANHGHVMLNIRIDVDDLAAFNDAGRRSYARDLGSWKPGMPVPPIPADAAEVIDGAAQAAADLLIEAFVRCYMPYVGGGPLIESLAGIAAWGDVDDKAFYPAQGRPLSLELGFGVGDRVVDTRSDGGAVVTHLDCELRGSDGYGLVVVYDDQPESPVSTGSDHFRKESTR